MASKHTHRFPILVTLSGDEREFEIDVQYRIAPGRPATPPTYSHGGLPPEPAEIEVLSATLAGDKEHLPDWFLRVIEDNEGAYQAMGEAADWGVPYRDPDCAREYEEEARRG